MRSTVARLGMWLMGFRRRRPVPPLRGYADTGRPGTRIILQHLFALFVFAVGAVASLYFFVGTYRGQQLDEDALNEYGKQFSGFEGPTLKALDNLPYVVVALAVVGWCWC